MVAKKADEKIYRVFVSSTYEDNVARRRRVLGAIRRAGRFKEIAMEGWTANAAPPNRVDADRVAEADLFVLIVAHRYGEIPAGGERSYTEMEFDVAIDRKIPILAFVIDLTAPIDATTAFDPGPDRWKKQERLEQFRARVEAGRIALPFNDEELGEAVLQALTEWRAEQEGESTEKTGRKKRTPRETREIKTYLKRIEAEPTPPV